MHHALVVLRLYDDAHAHMQAVGVASRSQLLLRQQAHACLLELARRAARKAWCSAKVGTRRFLRYMRSHMSMRIESSA